ncbi:MAG TPA: ferrochelatase [Thermoanaerobaculia bacterium]|jgi:ferrochelatase|nr:ferrochelatase [Thermoanaerobaculia bacterium]
MAFRGEPGPSHEPAAGAGVGVLIANLGTPDAPTAPALRRYLREFLSDPRVIEQPRWKWLPILYLFVLTRRPKMSAALYRKVWTPAGSPLLVGTEKLAVAVGEALRHRVAEPLQVAVGMRYGNPSLGSTMRRLADAGCHRILLFPLYPQYSGTTTAATFDAAFAELQGWRRIPELRTVASYHDDPAVIAALAATVRESWAARGRSRKQLFTFHGIPRRYVDAGDPYYRHCLDMARLLAAALGLGADDWLTTFQSLFGKEEWLRPYTDETMKRLGAERLESVDVLCPGFAVDCLETLEEIDGLNRELFTHAGGGEYRYVPCLNDRPDHVEALAGIALRQLGGWVTPRDQPMPSRASTPATMASQRSPSKP